MKRAIHDVFAVSYEEGDGIDDAKVFITPDESEAENKWREGIQKCHEKWKEVHMEECFLCNPGALCTCTERRCTQTHEDQVPPGPCKKTMKSQQGEDAADKKSRFVKHRRHLVEGELLRWFLSEGNIFVGMYKNVKTEPKEK